MGCLRRSLPLFTLAVFLTAGPSQAAAQDFEPPAHVSLLDGVATLERNGESQDVVPDLPVIAGDRIRTTDGRLELMFPDGTTLDLDGSTLLDVQSLTLFRVAQGRVLLRVAGSGNPPSAARFQLDTPAASVATAGPGEYRIAAFAGAIDGETELAVLRGAATLTTELATMLVRAGERSLARDNDRPTTPQPFNSARLDAFDQWSAAHHDARVARTTSTQYLPPDLRMYGNTFDQYGDWQYEAPYGYVWYPSVAVDWRPYYQGYWASIPVFGWTWIGSDKWAWPTHHYGRWGHAHNRWYWVPGKQWGPAWVSWGSAPGYVSWCPLGFDNRPVDRWYAWAPSVGSPWTPWVVVPTTNFGGRKHYAPRYAVNPLKIPRNAPFAMHTAAPIPAPRAVERGDVGTPGASASAGMAVPRDGQSPRYVLRGNSSASRTRATETNQIGGAQGSGGSIPRTRDQFRRPLSDQGGTAAGAVPSGVVTSGGVVPGVQYLHRGGGRSQAQPAEHPRAVPPPPVQPAEPGTVPRWSAPSIRTPALPPMGLPPPTSLSPPPLPIDRSPRAYAPRTYDNVGQPVTQAPAAGGVRSQAPERAVPRDGSTSAAVPYRGAAVRGGTNTNAGQTNSGQANGGQATNGQSSGAQSGNGQSSGGQSGGAQSRGAQSNSGGTRGQSSRGR